MACGWVVCLPFLCACVSVLCVCGPLEISVLVCKVGVNVCRFAQIERSRSGSGSNNSNNSGPSRRVNKAGVRHRRLQGNMAMDVDQPGSSQSAQRPGRGPRNDNRGRRGGSPGRRGGQRGGRGGSRGRGTTPLSRERLDMDLDSYMMKDAKTARTTLDNDLDAFMQQN